MEDTINKREEITDDEAVALLGKTNRIDRSRFATVFVPRTVLHAISIEYKPGIFTEEIRTFVRQFEYTTERRWAKALEVEKKFKKLNEEYAKALQAKKLPVNVKEPAGRLRGTPIN